MVVERIVERCKREQLMLYYKIPAFLDVKDFLLQLAKIRGRLRKVPRSIIHRFGKQRCRCLQWNTYLGGDS